MARRRVWGAICALMLMTGCTEDPADDPEPVVDAAVDATVDATLDPDAAPEVDAAPMPDMAPVEDRCAVACERLTLCAVDECEGIGGDEAAGVREACDALCAMTPPLANVIIGADGCGTVIEFGRDRLEEVLGETCGGNMSIDPDPLPTDVPCPFECGEGEQCLGGFCVRDDGTCETNYHCRPDREVCEDGTCVTAQFASCRGSDDCAPGGECRFFDPDPFATGTCIDPCQADAECPYGFECNQPFGGLCYFSICGPGTGNGTLYEDCTVGPNPGTCYPLTVGQAQQGQPGYCIEGGTALPGEPCDSQAEERTPESLALRCAPGGVCFGDDDNPLDPDDALDSVGTCTTLCDPRFPDTCAEDEVCADFSSPDDPDTQFNEQNFLGACLRSECDLFDPDACGEGESCRIFAVTTTAASCVPDGDVPVGEPCEGIDECAGSAFCGGNNREMQVCVGLCDPEAQGQCPADQFCYREDEWAVGFCIYPAEGMELPDMGPPEPDMGPAADMGPPEPDMGPPEMDMAPPVPDMAPPM